MTRDFLVLLAIAGGVWAAEACKPKVLAYLATKESKTKEPTVGGKGVGSGILDTIKGAGESLKKLEQFETYYPPIATGVFAALGWAVIGLVR